MNTGNNRGGVQDYLSKPNTAALKGAASLLILFHHLSQRTVISSVPLVGMLSQVMGYLVVAVFFFLSGYGLVAQSDMNRDKYIISFIKNRILPLYLYQVILMVIYSLLHVYMYQPDSIPAILRTMTFGSTVIAGGWYIQVTMVLYLLFYMTFRFVENNRTKQIMLISSGVVVFCAVLEFCKLPNTWFGSLLAFPMGMIWYEKRDILDRTCNNHRFMLVSGASLALVCLLECVSKCINE